MPLSNGASGSSSSQGRCLRRAGAPTLAPATKRRRASGSIPTAAPSAPLVLVVPMVSSVPLVLPVLIVPSVLSFCCCMDYLSGDCGVHAPHLLCGLLGALAHAPSTHQEHLHDA